MPKEQTKVVLLPVLLNKQEGKKLKHATYGESQMFELELRSPGV